MTPGRLEAERLYDRARALDAEARRAFLEDSCRGDPRLREELESLLEQAKGAEAFFERLTETVFSSSASIVEAVLQDDRVGGDPSLAPHLPVGQVIGHYRILGRIGAGGMGAVYRARDTRLDREVALKFLPAHLIASHDAEERLLVEAKAAAALEHPNVCTVHEIGATDDGRPFIAMALCEGETLKARLRRGPLPSEEALEIVDQIARGLAAAHAHGIVHRDVKPGNMTLAADGTVKLLDFGLAKVADATLTRPGVTPGTLAYMSPEQVRGDPVDARTDLWSLGVVLYEMLTGVRPFRGGNDRALIQAILHEDPEPVSKRAPAIPESVAEIVARLLRKNPDARHASAEQLRADLAQALPAERGPSRSSLITRRRLARLAGIAAVVAALAGAALWMASRDAQSIPDAERVLVADFANFTADSLLGDVVSQALRIDLARSPALRVAGDASITAALRRMLHDPGSRLDSDLAREVALREGIRAVIDGEVRRAGTGYVVSAAIVEAATGEVVDGWRETAPDSTGLIDAIDRLSAGIRGGLGESLASLRAGDPLWRATTSSLEALRRHAQGWRAFLRADYELAATLWEEATRIDPAFANAHFALAKALENAGVRRGRALEAIVKAYELRDRLSLPERHAIVATYYADVVGDLPKAIEAYRNQVAAAKAGGDFFMYASLSRQLALAGDLAGAEAAGREAAAVWPTAINQAGLVRVLYRRGKASEARAVLRDAMERFPGHPLLGRLRAEMALASGDFAAADSLARPLPSGARIDASDLRALNAAVQGRIGEAIGHFRVLREQLLSGGHAAAAAEITVAIGRLHIVRGEPDAALSAMEGFLAREPLNSLEALDRPHLSLAHFFADAGHPIRARQILAMYERDVPQEFRGPDRWRFLRTRAAILQAEESTREALSDLERATREAAFDRSLFNDWLLPLDARPELARAYDQAGQPDSAIATYERYLATPSLDRVAVDAFELPDAQFRLAELYEAKGDRAAAVRHYLRFAELWRDADSELQPRVETARRRAAGMSRDQNL